MVLSTKNRTLPFLTQEKWISMYGANPGVVDEYIPERHIESTTSEWGRNYLRYVNSGRFSDRLTHRLNQLDWGHYFYSKKSWVDESSMRFVNLTGQHTTTTPHSYSGGMMACIPSKIHNLGSAEMSETQLKQVVIGAGATAISRTIPHSSALDLGVTLGELRQDGLPRLPALTKLFGDLKGMPRKAAGEYLNYEFAWKPLVSDILGILEVAAQSERIYEQYKRDSGRHIRRRYSFPDDERAWTETLPSEKLYPRLPVQWWTGSSSQRSYGDLEISYRRTSRTWFAGSYRYHIPEYQGIRGDIAEWQRQARVLYGLQASPELLWQLTRWSWLVDWFANFGDILANVSALGTDNLTLHYGYIMRESTIRADYLWKSYIPPKDSSHTILSSARTSGVWNQKIRMKASPYGFGLDPGVFTPRQWAILTALGITMSPNKLFP